MEDDCVHCDGEGWDAEYCDCMEDCVACLEPSGRPCPYCTAKPASPELQEVLRKALEDSLS